MKSKERMVEPVEQKAVIDWSKIQLVTSTHTGNVVLTSGKSSEYAFEGVFVCGTDVGYSSTDLMKDNFKLLDKNVVIELQND